MNGGRARAGGRGARGRVMWQGQFGRGDGRWNKQMCLSEVAKLRDTDDCLESVGVRGMRARKRETEGVGMKVRRGSPQRVKGHARNAAHSNFE
jgi:hypothetical protein